MTGLQGAGGLKRPAGGFVITGLCRTGGFGAQGARGVEWRQRRGCLILCEGGDRAGRQKSGSGKGTDHGASHNLFEGIGRYLCG